MPFINPSNSTNFFPAGTYAVRWIRGCMRYSTLPTHGWSVNDLFPGYWWYLGTAAGNMMVSLPGHASGKLSGGAYSNCAACSSAALTFAANMFSFSGGCALVRVQLRQHVCARHHRAVHNRALHGFSYLRLVRQQWENTLERWQASAGIPPCQNGLECQWYDQQTSQH